MNLKFDYLIIDEDIISAEIASLILFYFGIKNKF